MKKILVTGASGFIGQGVTKKLAENYIVETYCRELKNNTPRFIVERHIDQNILFSPYKDVAYDYVINCIACSDTSSKDWDTLYEANCQATLALINHLNFNHFIQFSSFSVFSKNTIALGIADPNNLYGLSKLISEKFLEIFSSKKNKFIVLRMPIVIGEQKKNGDIISYFYDSLKQNKTITLFNNGKYHRNIIHINEVVNCVSEIVRNNIHTDNHTVINLNSLNTMSIHEICLYMKDKLKSESKIKFTDRLGTNDFDSIVVDNSPKTYSYEFKSCIETIDRFLEEKRSNLKKINYDVKN